jgi:hypothetical protein
MTLREAVDEQNFRPISGLEERVMVVLCSPLHLLMKARPVPQPDLACKPKYVGMWYLLQSSIIFAVVASNIHWQWTPSRYRLCWELGWLTWPR